MTQENLTVVNCAPKFLDFIDQLLISILDKKEDILNHCDFLFVFNDCESEDDLRMKAKKAYPIPNTSEESIDHKIDEIFKSINTIGEFAFNSHYRFEIGSLEYAFKNFDYEQFLILQCSYEILDKSFFEIMFSQEGKIVLGMGCYNSGHCYLLKFPKQCLVEWTEFPKITSKRDSVYYESKIRDFLTPQYRGSGCQIIWGYNVQNEKFGRMNQITEGLYKGIKVIRKYRGTWASHMIPQSWV